MRNFINEENVVSDRSPSNESRLFLGDNTRENSLKPVGKNFGTDLVDKGAKADRAVVRDFDFARHLDLRNKSDESPLEAWRH